jgi:hypothetical protein
MWSRSYLQFVTCPRTSRFLDYVPCDLRKEFVARDLLLGGKGQADPINWRVLACRPIASLGKSLGPTEQTVASVTLRDRNSGQVVATTICIGLTSSSVMQDGARTSTPVPTPRRPSQRPGTGVAHAKVPWRHAGKGALWAAGSRPKHSCTNRSRSTVAASR